MLERVRRQLDGVGQVVSCEDLVQLRALLLSSPNAPTPAVRPVPPGVEPCGLVTWGELVVDRVGQRVTWRGEVLPLTPTERELLTLLVGPPLAVWSYERLCVSALGGADTAALQSTIRRLRRRLRGLPGGPQVHTVRGIGYRLDPPPRRNHH
ncbi:winged helix-turn-helix domain-containing protein [Micromonospora sp. NBC_00362]|uniref:winged helix-turn-helix domain-containing protein n=1 Tax=Micromonospora sp. NBC_00362 TaxID=2975975 RepID=UPI00225B88CA|nr:winged helix-turn-helix domain-containing protein [Micromonospora sp. NBC_00362]MCX5120165.1 winged helix-turn-helix domain-containing protein [Micromonospora sp. NBC_00362]